MSQKINPVSNKLGIIKTWNYELLKYGRNFKNYTRFIQPRNYIFDYINRFCLKHGLLIENISIVQTFHQTFINVFVIHLKKKGIIQKNQNLLNVISCWLNSSIILSFYKKSNFGNSALLTNNYITYLFSQKANSPKKTVQLIYKMLKSQKNSIQIKYTTNGIKIIELKGFKIEISGCFESSRSQMSKTIKCNFGIIPLTKLNGYIDYSNNTFFTKFGSCGLKIWLFYEFR